MKVIYEISSFGELYENSWSQATKVLDGVQVSGQKKLLEWLFEMFDDVMIDAGTLNDYIAYELDDDLARDNPDLYEDIFGEDQLKAFHSDIYENLHYDPYGNPEEISDTGSF